MVYAATAFARLHLVPNGIGQSLTWAFFGRQSRRYLRGNQIFHVRSGAGQGGAIREAKALGMRVVVDHSIAHPAYIERVVSRPGHRSGITVNDSFWKLVLKDCSEADVLLVNSEFVRQTFISEGYTASRIEVVYLGVRPDFFGLKETYSLRSLPRLLFTGAFCYRKGADLLIDTLEGLDRLGCTCELHVAGDDSECRPLAQRYRGSSRIVFHGSLPQSELKQLLVAADLYVFPTLAEGCAKSAMEAMAAGLPVVTTLACGLPGVAGKHHLIVQERSAEVWADEIDRLLKQPHRRENIGRAGAALVAEQYRWDDYGRNVAALYSRIYSQ